MQRSTFGLAVVLVALSFARAGRADDGPMVLAPSPSAIAIAARSRCSVAGVVAAAARSRCFVVGVVGVVAVCSRCSAAVRSRRSAAVRSRRSAAVHSHRSAAIAIAAAIRAAAGARPIDGVRTGARRAASALRGEGLDRGDGGRRCLGWLDELRQRAPAGLLRHVRARRELLHRRRRFRRPWRDDRLQRPAELRHGRQSRWASRRRR